jgi:hypothetical protein
MDLVLSLDLGNVQIHVQTSAAFLLIVTDFILFKVAQMNIFQLIPGSASIIDPLRERCQYEKVQGK